MGYRMLGSTCNKCQAILMQDRQGEDYCIGCVDIDSPEQDQMAIPTAVDIARSVIVTKDSSTTNFSTNTPCIDNQDQNTQAGMSLSHSSHSRQTQANPSTHSVSS